MKCKGCELCRMRKVPDFASDKEMIEFWRTHSPSDFPQANIVFKSGGRKVHPRVRISFMIAPDVKADLEKLAEAEATGYQTLMHRYISERVSAEVRNMRNKPTGLSKRRPLEAITVGLLAIKDWPILTLIDCIETSLKPDPVRTIRISQEAGAATADVGQD